MTDAQASEAGRYLAHLRHGDRVLRRATSTVLERADLTEATRAELEQIAGPPLNGDTT